MSTKFVMPLSNANGSAVSVATVSAVPASTCVLTSASCPDSGICPEKSCSSASDCGGGSCEQGKCPVENCTPAQPAGFNITNITGPHNTPTEIQLREVTKCSIDAYAFYNYGTYTPDRDGVVNKDLSAHYGCNDGYNVNFNFGKIFSEVQFYCQNDWGDPLFCNSPLINDYTAIPSHNYTLHKNYCAITLKMKTGKSCADLNFGVDYYHFKDGDGNKITSAVSTLDSIKVKCGTNITLVPYPITNSIVTFDPNSNPPTIEFTPNNNEDLGCSYQHNGTNYVAFSCNDAGTSVEAVEYRCGL